MQALILFGLSCLAAVCAAPQYASYSQSSGDKYLPPHSTKPPTLVQTNFYSYAAPEEHDHQTLSKDIYVGKPQKNYRVVFIKAPKPADASVKFNIDVAPQEEKTAIYVLSKKEGEVKADAVVNEGEKTVSKPEVYFVRYKTPEEAHAVQQEIQEEYDKLGGHKEFSDEGVAPLTSVAGALDSLGSDGSYNYQQVKGEEKHVISQYLTPVHHK